MKNYTEESKLIKSLMEEKQNKQPTNSIEDIETNIKNIHEVPGVFMEVGEVISAADNIVKIIGLSKAFFSEIIKIKNYKGMVMEISIDYISVVMFEGGLLNIQEGDRATRTYSVLSAPCGMGLLGRVINSVGEPIDMKGDIITTEYLPVERPAPSVMSRKPIHEPLYTGTMSIDSTLAIGKGQRELIIGDRRTGKTTLAINTILNQAYLHSFDNEAASKNGNPNEAYKYLKSDKKAVYCVYVAIGLQRSNIAELIQKIKHSMPYTVIVSASASDPASEKFIAPYLGCSIAEWFRDNGMNALIIYDDLSKHASAYREISLLLRRPPGREAYPGDIFYTHSRLLERAANLDEKHGSGSLTALPIIETKQGNISAYIPTNVISITDGQIYVDINLLNRGFSPAIDVPLSVSRVGSAAQDNLIKHLSRGLKLIMSEYKEMLEFSKVSSSIDEASQQILNRGKLLEILFSQTADEILKPYELALLLYIYKNNLITLSQNVQSIIKNIKTKSQSISKKINSELKNNDFSPALKDKIQNIIDTTNQST